VLFGAMDSAITSNEAEDYPLADRNSDVGPEAVVDHFAAVPSIFMTAATTSWCSAAAAGP
jgi:hypothetical protein